MKTETLEHQYSSFFQNMCKIDKIWPFVANLAKFLKQTMATLFKNLDYLIL